MTVHRKMFKNKTSSNPDPATLHRVYCEWESGYWLNSTTSEFNIALQEMVAELGPPDKVEFRAHKDGWLGSSLFDDGD